jgi:hypothetical protein
VIVAVAGVGLVCLAALASFLPGSDLIDHIARWPG